MPASQLPEYTRALIAKALKKNPSPRAVAAELDICPNSVYKYAPASFEFPRGGGKGRVIHDDDRPDAWPKVKAVKSSKLPPAKHELITKSGPELPEPVANSYEPEVIDVPGNWLVLSDTHVPHHDRTTIELAVKEAKRRNVAGVLLNGDILDSHEISAHDKDPTAPRYVHEIEVGVQFMAWLRSQLPNAFIVMKEGNHDDRLGRYIINKAPALFGLEGLNLPALLHLDDYGVEWVGDKRVIRLGKLNVIHGHEFQGGSDGAVNPARGLYMKARSVVLAGHSHKTSEHHERNILGKSEAAWSIGCACYLHPKWNPLNGWNHGMAFVDVENDGGFIVENRRVLNGKLV